MFGIGAQEMLIIGLLCLLVFGPSKLPRMARELGGFVQKARASVEEFESKLVFEEDREDLREEEDGEDREPHHRELEEGRSTAEGRESEGLQKGHAEERERVEDQRPEYASARPSREAAPGDPSVFEGPEPIPVRTDGGEREGGSEKRDL